MPSDVHIQHSAHLQQAQSKLIGSPNDSVLSDDISSNNQSVYLQRFKALREAGFDDATAARYSSIYSSVNEVIDAILSQSLVNHLVIEKDQLKGSHQTSNGFEHKSNQMITSVDQQQAAGFNQSSSTDLSKFTFDESSTHQRSEAPNFANDTKQANDKQVVAATLESDLPADLAASSHLNTRKRSITQADHLSGIEHFEEPFKDRNGSSRLTDSLFDSSELALDDTNDKLGELFGFNLFAASAHDLSGIGQFKSICEMADSKLEQLTNDESFFANLKSSRPSEDLRNVNRFLSDDVASTNNAFNRNLLATVLKDGFFDSDEIVLDDEGVVDQNVVSSSPSSSLSSSGASSLLLDSSSSPSSFSSLSSSISTTPPNALTGFESSPTESGFGDTLFGMHYTSKQLDSISLDTKSKFDSFPSLDLDCTDLTKQIVNKLAYHDAHSGNGHRSSFNGRSANLCPVDETLGALDKSFLTYNRETCSTDMNCLHGHPSFDSKTCQNPQNSNPAYPEMSQKYLNESFLSYPFNSMHSNADNLSVDNSFSSQPNSVFPSHYNKYLSQTSAESPFNCKMASNEDSSDLINYLNGCNQMHNSLFDYDQNNRANDLFGLNLERLTKNAFDSKTDLFGDFHFGQKANNNLTAFSEGTDALFSPSPESDLLCANSQSHYATDYLNQRTFADIAASNSISGGPKLNSDHCFGAIGDCKLPKSSPLSCSNLNLHSSNYFALFGNGTTGSGNQNAGFYEPNAHSMAKKPFCVQQNYRSSLSPMGNKYASGQLLTDQSNLCPPGMQIGPMMNQSSMANGHSCELTASLNCDPSSKPTNLMGYKGLWLCNIDVRVTLAYLKRRFRRFGHFTSIQTFERRATNGSNIVFVHYDNPYSPVEAIACLHNYTGQDLCADATEPLKLRFAPSMEQSRAGQLPTLEQARKIVERHGECFNWRLSSGCHRGIRCQLKHVPINKEIDSQPWVKALKKKNNDL